MHKLCPLCSKEHELHMTLARPIAPSMHWNPSLSWSFLQQPPSSPAFSWSINFLLSSGSFISIHICHNFSNINNNNNNKPPGSHPSCSPINFSVFLKAKLWKIVCTHFLQFLSPILCLTHSSEDFFFSYHSTKPLMIPLNIKAISCSTYYLIYKQRHLTQSITPGTLSSLGFQGTIFTSFLLNFQVALSKVTIIDFIYSTSKCWSALALSLWSSSLFYLYTHSMGDSI